MGTAALWCWHLSFSLLIVATALAWGQGRSSTVRRAAIALALVPLLVLHATLSWTTLRLRFHSGLGFSPWLAACGLFALHALGVWLLLSRARRRPGAAAWPVGTLAVCSLAALALEGTTLWNLELQAHIELSRLSLEAGRIAWRESPPRPRPEENAAPLYLEASEKLQRGDEGVLDPWRGQETLDANDPELRAALQSLSAALESARAAGRRPACWFEPETGLESAGSSVVSLPVKPWFRLADALELDARVRAADGDVSGALADVEGLFALARHAVQEPSLVSALLASSVRSKALGALAHALAAPSLAARDLEDLDPTREPSLVAVAPRALAREEAFCLAAVGQLSEAGSRLGFPGGARGLLRNRLASALYNAFLLGPEVAELRSSLKEIQALALSPLAELRALRDSNGIGFSRRGYLASYLLPNMLTVLLTLHRSDSELELAALAVEVTRWRLVHGGYPQTLAELGREDGRVLLEGDGTYVRLTRPDAGDAELRLPPVTQPR
jgi:hypothetical protein